MNACRKCQEPIIFAVVSNKQGKPPSRMPLNPHPDPAGNCAVYRDDKGTLVGRVIGKTQKAQGYERLFMPHFATCQTTAPAQAAPERAAFHWSRLVTPSGAAAARRRQRGQRPARRANLGYRRQP